MAFLSWHPGGNLYGRRLRSVIHPHRTYATLPRPGSFYVGLRSGALAGAVSALAFTALHDVIISDIWFSLVPMMAAGALCGLCVAWTYARLFDRPTLIGWIAYNLLYVLLFVLLGGGSVLLFEPVTTMAAVLAANAAPRDLIVQALPFTAAFTIACAALISFVWARTLLDVVAVGVTCVVLVTFLGLNVSALGLVALPRSAAFLVAELLILILVLNLVYMVVFWYLERTVSALTTRPRVQNTAA